MLCLLLDTNDIDMSTGGKAPVVPTLFDEQPTVNADEATVGGAADGKTNQEGIIIRLYIQL